MYLYLTSSRYLKINHSLLINHNLNTKIRLNSDFSQSLFLLLLIIIISTVNWHDFGHGGNFRQCQFVIKYWATTNLF